MIKVKKIVGDIEECDLKICINKLRDLSLERLILSQQLDNLIVQYMDLQNNCATNKKFVG